MSHTGALVLRRGLRIGDVGAASKGQVEEGEVCGTGKSQPKKKKEEKQRKPTSDQGHNRLEGFTAQPK